jgi:hypothetical protein
MPDPPTRILFIGNSYTNRNDLPGMIARLSASADPPKAVETDRVIANGMALKHHWDKGLAGEALAQSGWDFVSLQEQSTLPFKNPARMHDSVEKLDEAIRKQNAKTVLYLTWARQDAPERQAEITEAFMSIGKKIGALVVPAGIAWQNALREQPDLPLYDPDKSHPTVEGSYLAACAFYSVLFEASPEGLWRDAKGLDAERAAFYQRIAWKTV